MHDPVQTPYVIESEQPTLWRRLGRRFQTYHTRHRHIEGIGSVVHPVTIADELLLDWDAEQGSVSNSAGESGGKVGLTVPSGKLWRVSAVYIVRSTGDNEVSYVSVAPSSSGTQVRIVEQTAASSLVSGVLGSPLVMPAGSVIIMGLAGSGVSAGTFVVRAWRAEEDAF